MELKEVQKAHKIVNEIDWDMTPEEAVTLYLEWGNNWEPREASYPIKG